MAENETMHTLTPEQSRKIAEGLYQPTLTRIGILMDNLIRMTGNGDFALWAPLMALEKALMSLRWSATDSPERFLAMIALALRRYADKCDAYTLGLIAARDAGAPLPAFEVWTDEDTVAVYDTIDAKFPPVELTVTPEEQATPGAPPEEPQA